MNESRWHDHWPIHVTLYLLSICCCCVQIVRTSVHFVILELVMKRVSSDLSCFFHSFKWSQRIEGMNEVNEPASEQVRKYKRFAKRERERKRPMERVSPGSSMARKDNRAVVDFFALNVSMGSISWLLFKLMWIQQCEMRNAYTFISHKTLTTDVKWSWLLWFTLSDKWCTRAYLNDSHSFRKRVPFIRGKAMVCIQQQWRRNDFIIHKHGKSNLRLIFGTATHWLYFIPICFDSFSSSLSLESFLSHNIFVCLCVFSIYSKFFPRFFHLNCDFSILLYIRRTKQHRIHCGVRWFRKFSKRIEHKTQWYCNLYGNRVCVWVEIKKKFFFARRFVRNVDNF